MRPWKARPRSEVVLDAVSVVGDDCKGSIALMYEPIQQRRSKPHVPVAHAPCLANSLKRCHTSGVCSHIATPDDAKQKESVIRSVGGKGRGRKRVGQWPRRGQPWPEHFRWSDEDDHSLATTCVGSHQALG